jgi:hypothetical protein
MNQQDKIFQQAISDRLQCGWTTQKFLSDRGMIAPNVYLWRVLGSGGRATLVEKVADHPSVKDVVIYRELSRNAA